MAVTVHLWRSFRVAHDRLRRQDARCRGEDLRRAIPFSERDPFNAGALADGASALERRLGDGRLRPCQRRARGDLRRRATFTVTVVYRIAAGSAAAWPRPSSTARSSPFTRGDAAERTRLKVGQALPRGEGPRPARSGCASSCSSRVYFKAVGRADRGRADRRRRPDPSRLPHRPSARRYVIEAAGIKEKQARKRDPRPARRDRPSTRTCSSSGRTRRGRPCSAPGTTARRSRPTAAGTDPVTVKVDRGRRGEVRRRSASPSRATRSVPDETLRADHGHAPEGPAADPDRAASSTRTSTPTRARSSATTRRTAGSTAKVEKPAVTEGSKPDLLDVAITSSRARGRSSRAGASRAPST